MSKSEFVLETEMHKILYGLEIETNYQIPARKAELVFLNKKERTCHLVNFAFQ